MSTNTRSPDATPDDAGAIINARRASPTGADGDGLDQGRPALAGAGRADDA